MKFNNSEKLEPFKFCVSLDSFGEFGAGVMLYFYFLKFFGIVLLLMGLISAYPLFLNTFQGDYYKKSAYSEV